MPHMTRLVARLILAMLILPVTGTLFVFLFVALIMPAAPPSPSRILLLWVLVYAFVGVYWVLLWWSAVRWTRKRVLLTALALAVALALAMALGGALMLYGPPMMDPGLALFLGGGVVPIVWVLATVLIWRETPAERMERISLACREAVCCPICGYNLTGLTEARCPECGSKFTLDQLLTSQPKRDEVTLHQE